MSSCLPCAGSATSSAALPHLLPRAAEQVPGLCPLLAGREGTDAGGLPTGMIAVRAADVICPGGAATLVAGPAVASGEPLVFTHPVTMAPAVVRRGGAVQAGGCCPAMCGSGCWRGRPGGG